MSSYVVCTLCTVQYEGDEFIQLQEKKVVAPSTDSILPLFFESSLFPPLLSILSPFCSSSWEEECEREREGGLCATSYAHSVCVAMLKMFL